MTDYRETYEFADTTYGIEDHEQPGDHFFPQDYASGKSKRFHNWCGGGGIGSHDTLREARIHLLNYALSKFDNEVKKIQSRLSEIEEAVKEINNIQALMRD